MNIVILEDEAITTLFLQSALEELGHNVIGVFDSGESLLESLKSIPKIDLLLCDIKINGNIDGIELVKKLKQVHESLLLIYISSFKDSLTISRAKETKPNAYLVKPILESDISAALMVVESIKESRDEKNNILIELAEGCLYDKSLQEIYQDNKIVQLSVNERICLDTLILQAGSITSLEELILKIWNGENNRIQSLRELVFRLRKKVPNLDIQSVSKVGYILSIKP